LLAGIVGLIILTVVALQFPGVQSYISRKALSSISEKTHNRIEVGSVNIAFPNSVVLHNIFVESRPRDTLLFIRTLAADVNLFRLFSHDIKLNGVRIDSLTAHISRTLPGSNFNFDSILNALSPDSTTADTNPDTSASPGWKFRFGELRLNGFHGTYDDEVSGLKMRIQLGTLKASLDKFDLDKKQFHIDELFLANTTASVVDTKESPPDESQSAAVDFGIEALSLTKLHFIYENIVSGERYSVDLGTSTLLAEKVDLPSHHIAVKNFLLENTNVVIAQPKKNENLTEHSRAAVLPWVISLDHLILNGNSVQYDVHGAAKTKGLDPNHLRLDDLIMRAENLYYSESRITADISHTLFREQSGLELRELSGVFVLDSVRAQLKDFTMETAASRIRQNTILSFSSLDALKNLPGSVNVKATIGDSHLAISDLLFFQPSLPLRNTPGASIRFSSQLSGLIQDLRVEEFRATAGDSTSIDVTGSIRGLPEAETAYYDLNLRLLSSGRNDIQTLVADTVLPKGIVLPASIRISGKFKGTAENFSASSDIVTNIGSLNGNVSLNSGQGVGSKASRWKTDAILEEFNVGSFLNDPETFGPVSLKASAAGTGLSKDDFEAQLNVQVDKAVVNGYPYRRLSIDGTASPKMFVGKGEIQDSSIAFTFNGIVNTSEENPTYKFTLDLKGADLHRLNFTPDDIRVAGIITSDLTGQDVNDINGTIGTRNVVIIKNSKRYVIDSLVYASVHKEDKTHISIESTIFAGQFDGTIVPGDLPEVLEEHSAHYFILQGERRNGNLKAQAFTFRITLRDPTILTDVFFPDLHQLSAGTIEGNYNSDKKNLNVNIDIPKIGYGDFKIDRLTVRVTSDADLLQATLRVGSIADSTLRVTNIQLAAKAGHDSIEVALQSTRSDGFTKMRLAGILNSVPDGHKFRFNKDGIVFQNLQWDIPSDNYLLFGKNQLIAHNLQMRGAGQSLSLNSTDEKNQRSPLRIEFNNFNFATLSQVVERDSGVLGGILTGNVVLQNLEKQMAFTSDLTIKDFSFRQRHVGDIALRANNQTENVYDVHMDIAGNGNQIAILGKYRSEESGSELDLT
jgi:translocation and assembly module TamB